MAIKLAATIAVLSVAGAPLPAAERSVTTADGCRLFVREVGAGPPVVLVTGGPGFSGDYFVPLARRLARSSRAVVPDTRGSGRSTVPRFDATTVSLDALVGDLEAIREALGIERWAVVAHSFGGMVAMSYVARHPERVTGLALIGPGGVSTEFLPRYQRNILEGLDEATRAELAALRPVSDTLEARAEVGLHANRLMVPGMVAARGAVRRVRSLLEPGSFEPRVAVAVQPSLTAYDLRGRLSTYAGPVLIMQGRGDPLGPETVAGIRREIPQANVHWIERAGHWPFLERPAALRRALLAFLDSLR